MFPKRRFSAAMASDPSSEAADEGAPAGTGSFYYVVSCEATPRRCNGHAELCDRRFDEVAHATTHNAMSSEQDGWIFPNQSFDVPRQLEAGVRALMLDTHDWFGEASLCRPKLRRETAR